MKNPFSKSVWETFTSSMILKYETLGSFVTSELQSPRFYPEPRLLSVSCSPHVCVGFVQVLQFPPTSPVLAVNEYVCPWCSKMDLCTTQVYSYLTSSAPGIALDPPWPSVRIIWRWMILTPPVLPLKCHFSLQKMCTFASLKAMAYIIQQVSV